MIRRFAGRLEPVIVLCGMTALLMYFVHWSFGAAAIVAFVAYFVSYFLIRFGLKFVADRRNNSN